MRNFLLATFFTLAVLSITSVFSLEWLTKQKVDPIIQVHISALSLILPEYNEDNDFLRSQKIFEPLLKTQNFVGEDAGKSLNHLLHWLPESSQFQQPAQVPADIQDFILRLGREWQLHTSPFKVYFERKRVDLKIFNSLESFSYWNIEKNSPIQKLIEQGNLLSQNRLPSIDSLDLIALCKLRYIEALFKGDYLVALQEVRKFVQLLLSTENYRLEHTAISILEAEHTAYTLYIQNEWIKPGDWIPIDSNATRRASRAIQATKGLLRFWTPPQILKQIYLSPQLPIGFCSAVSESLSQEFALKDIMTEHLPLERDYSQSFQILDAIWSRAQNDCHPYYVAQLVLKNKFSLGGFVDTPFSRIPYVRKLFGLSQSASQFEGFKGYSLSTN